jgi:D-alanyl-D-alanine carboxypeptidase (penicillin-binding protein 5/6)
VAAASVVALAPGGAAQTPAPSPTLAPPPTPVPVPGGGTSPSPFPSVLHTPPPSSTAAPTISADAAMLVDLDTGQGLLGVDVGRRVPIASLTKIMTAYLVLTRTSPSDVVTVSAEAASGRVVGISNLGLVEGERIPVGELVYALLLQSANDAAVALAEHVSGSVEGFVDLMNRTAVRLGLTRTRFASPNGLDDTGYSTARDLVRLTLAAYDVPGFADVVATRTHTIPAPDGGSRVVQNRNALLWLYPGALGVKTGFTSAAGFCVVATAERGDERRLAVVLGEPGEPFSDAAALLDYGFAAFEHRELLRPGRALGTVPIGGRDVAVETGAGLRALVPVADPTRRAIVVDPQVRFPPARGQTIGSVEITLVGGRTVGSVPLVVTDVPPPPPPTAGPWWRRAIGAVVDAGAGLVDALVS